MKQQDNRAEPQEKKIRFIDSHYNLKFYIPDGGKIRITFRDGHTADRACKYIDDYHLYVGKCCMPGKSRLTSYLLKKSVKTNTMSGVTTTRSLIPRKHRRKSHRRHLATLWSKCSKTNSNQINKDDKKPLAMSFIPTAKDFLDKYGFICCTTTCQSFSNLKTTGLQE